MEELKVYGHYYKMFKGDGGMVTVIALDEDMVTIINGHHTKEELDCTTHIKMRCNKNTIITNITEKQKKQINKEMQESRK